MNQMRLPTFSSKESD